MISAIDAKITADSAKLKADTIQRDKSNAELQTIFKFIDEECDKGNYSWGNEGTLLPETIKTLEDLGFKYESHSQYNEPSYYISWKTPKKSTKLFYKDNKIGSGNSFNPNSYEVFVNTLIIAYENVSWGGEKSKFFSVSSYDDTVVVYQAGVRGPADWFYINEVDKWAHGGYAAYKETYTNEEFIEYITEILKNNKKYHNTK